MLVLLNEFFYLVVIVIGDALFLKDKCYIL